MKIDFVSKLPSEGIGFLVWQKHGMQGDNWCELQMRNSRNSFLPHQVSLPCLRFMGGSKEEEEEEPRQYSWDVARQTLDLSQFTIDRFDPCQ